MEFLYWQNILYQICAELSIFREKIEEIGCLYSKKIHNPHLYHEIMNTHFFSNRNVIILFWNLIFFHLKCTIVFPFPCAYPTILYSCKMAKYNCIIIWLLRCVTYQLFSGFHNNKHPSEHQCSRIWHSHVYLWHKFLEIQLLSERACNDIVDKPNSTKYQQNNFTQSQC